jgi:hypothetical protein
MSDDTVRIGNLLFIADLIIDILKFLSGTFLGALFFG